MRKSVLMFVLFFYNSFLVFGMISPKEKVRVDSIFRFARDLTYYDLEATNQSIEILESNYKLSKDDYTKIRWLGLKFIRNSFTMNFYHELDEIFELLMPQLNTFELNDRLRIELSISYYFLQTGRLLQNIDFLEHQMWPDLEKSNDLNFVTIALFCLSNSKGINRHHQKLVDTFSNIALNMYDDIIELNTNDTVKAYYDRYIAAMSDTSDVFLQILKYKKSFQSSKKVGHRISASFQAYVVSVLYKKENDLENAIFFLKKSLELSEGFPFWRGFYNCELGIVYEQTGNLDLAIDAYLASYSFYIGNIENFEMDKSINNLDRVIFVLNKLTYNYLKLEMPKEGFKYYQLAKNLNKRLYLIGYQNFDYYYDNLYSENDEIILEKDKVLIENFFKDHELHSIYPEYPPKLSLIGENDVILNFQRDSLVRAQGSNGKNKKVSNIYDSMNLFLISLFIVFLFGAFFQFKKYRKTKLRKLEIQNKFDKLEGNHSRVLEELSRLNVNVVKPEEWDSKKYFQVPNQNKTLLKLKDIIYIEAQKQFVLIYLSNGKKIKDWNVLKFYHESLPSSIFVRIHRSYIVNILEIEFVLGDLVFLKTKKSLPIGQSYAEALNQEFKELKPFK